MRRSSRKWSHPRDWIVSILLPDNAHPVVAVAEVAFFAAQPPAERDQLLRAHGSKTAIHAKSPPRWQRPTKLATGAAVLQSAPAASLSRGGSAPFSPPRAWLRCSDENSWLKAAREERESKMDESLSALNGCATRSV